VKMKNYLMFNDELDAGWHQQQLEESQRWEQHRQTVREFREYLTKEGLMKTSQMVQSKFLKKDDFPSPEVLTIKDCSLEEVGKSDTRWVLFFKEKTKGVVLNVTKIKQLEGAYGDDSDYWNGKKVKLSHDPTVMMGTQQVGGIKFTFPPNLPPVQPRTPVKADPMTPAEDEFDDDIPF
jgi:hypothetical protein